MSTYLQDLDSLLATKLSYVKIAKLKLTSKQWDNFLSEQWFKYKFLFDFGAILPSGADHELWGLLYIDLDLRLILNYAIKQQHNDLVVSLVNKFINQIDINDLLINASSYSNLPMVEFLLLKGANIHALQDQALISAAYNSYLALIEFLLLNGANIHAQKDLALINATYCGNLLVVEFLLAKGANIHAREDQSLIIAVRYDNLAIVELLLLKGAEIHAQEDRSLISAANNGYLAMVELLLANGANIHARNDKLLTLAKKYNKKLSELLENITKLKTAEVNSMQCIATTKLGMQCKKQVISGQNYCNIHK